MTSFHQNGHKIHQLMQNIRGDLAKSVAPLFDPSACDVTPVAGDTGCEVLTLGNRRERVPRRFGGGGGRKLLH